jgi:hypothetical protein
MTLTDLLHDLERGRFYGSIEIKYESGHVTLIRKTESLKLSEPDFRNTRGEADEHKPTR